MAEEEAEGDHHHHHHHCHCHAEEERDEKAGEDGKRTGDRRGMNEDFQWEWKRGK